MEMNQRLPRLQFLQYSTVCGGHVRANDWLNIFNQIHFCKKIFHHLNRV